MPPALAVVVSVGVRAIEAALADLIADHGPGDAAEDGALGVAATAGDGAPREGAGSGPDDGAANAVGALLLARGLGERESRHERQRGDAGDDHVLAHFVLTFLGRVWRVGQQTGAKPAGSNGHPGLTATRRWNRFRTRGWTTAGATGNKASIAWRSLFRRPKDERLLNMLLRLALTGRVHSHDLSR